MPLALFCLLFSSVRLTLPRLLLASAPVASVSSSLPLHLRPRRASLIALISSSSAARPRLPRPRPPIPSFVDTVLLLSSRKRPSPIRSSERYYSSYLTLGFPSLRHVFFSYFFFVMYRTVFGNLLRAFIGASRRPCRNSP